MPQSTEHGLARSRLNTRDSYPIYEGLDSLDLILSDRNTSAQWTRVPSTNKRTLAVVPAPAVPPHIFQSSPANKAGDAETEVNRRRSATRVQLSIPPSGANVNAITDVNPHSDLPAMETAVSPGVYSNVNSSQNTPNEIATRQKTTATDHNGHGLPGIRLRPALRRAATISPVRQYRAYQQEISDVPDLETQQPAMSSGFVSAGSIVAAPDDGSEGANKSGVVKGKNNDFHALPPPVDVHVSAQLYSAIILFIT